MIASERPPIPAEIKRLVRQRCGFGCIICGNPVIVYHHMIAWSIVKEHTEQNLTLLCGSHHDEVHKKLLASITVENANKEPYCIKNQNCASKYFFFEGNTFLVALGGNNYTADASYHRDPVFGNFHYPLIVDSVSLIRFKFEDNHILLSIKMYDRNNDLMLEVRDNELWYSIGSWDIEWTGNNLVIREKKRQLFVNIIFGVPHKIVISGGYFFLNGIEIKITPSQLNINNSNSIFRASRISRCLVGLHIGKYSENVIGAAVVTDVENRYTVTKIIPPNDFG